MTNDHDRTVNPVDCPECVRMIEAGEPDAVWEHANLKVSYIQEDKDE